MYKEISHMRKNISKMKKLQIIVCLLLVLGFLYKSSEAQQEPMYTQYNFNVQTINPAYVGTWESLGFLVLGRYQWVGMNDAPRTYTFSMQGPTRWEKVSLGLNVIADKVGLEKRLTLAGDYSYLLRLTDRTFLRLGLKAGVTNYSNPLTEYTGYPENGEEVYTEDIDSKYIPNFGVGAFLYSENFYVGFSVPKIIESDLTDNGTHYSAYSEMQHFYLSAGYIFKLSENLDFKPTMLTKYTFGDAPQLDLTGNFLICDRVWLGAMCRIGDSFGFIGQFVLGEHTRIGYAVDFTTSKLRKASNGTHEFMVSYEFGTRDKWDTPRRY